MPARHVVETIRLLLGSTAVARKAKGFRWHAPRRLAFEPLEPRHLLAVFTVENLNDAPVSMTGGLPVTLRQAIFDANSNQDADTVQFAAGLSGAINLSVIGDTAEGPSALLVTSPITIQGNVGGITIGRSATAEMRLFHVTASGNLTLESLSLIDGLARGTHGMAPGESGGDGRGGAIFNEGTLVITRSTLRNNAAIGGNGGAGASGGAAFGGAIFNDDGTVSLLNTTLSGSIVQSGSGSTVLSSFGGGIYSRNGTLEIYNSTITNSTGNVGRGVYVVGDGAGSTATLLVQSTIIGQADTSAQLSELVIAADNNGEATSSGTHNLIRRAVGFEGTFATDDPLLAPLANNGGPTFTHALPSDSPAINQGANPLSLLTDQRGESFVRVVGGQGDIGAFELQTTAGPEPPGDYNRDQSVDAADYVLWRKTLGDEVEDYDLADGDGNGIIEIADYSVWTTNFGDGQAEAAAESRAAVAAGLGVGASSTGTADEPVLTRASVMPGLRQYAVRNDTLLSALSTMNTFKTNRDDSVPPQRRSLGALNDKPNDAAVLDSVWAEWHAGRWLFLRDHIADFAEPFAAQVASQAAKS